MILTLVSLSGCSLLPPDLDKALDPSDTQTRVFIVPAGSSGYRVGDLLEVAGFIESTNHWKWFLKNEQESNCLKAGDFLVAPSMTIPEISEVLCGPPIPDDEPFTVLEGWRIREIDEALAAKGWADAGEYTAAASNLSLFTLPQDMAGDLPNLEGYLFPDTYMVEPNRDPDNFVRRFIQRQLNAFRDQFLIPAGATVNLRGLNDLVIVASMVQREEPEPSLMPIVAGIIWKRLDNDWHLGIDATSHYSLLEWNDRAGLLAALRDPDDPYNTRLRHGLPPTAIGNSGLDALNAAMSPEHSRYWYYLHDSNGRLHPARSAAEHEANRRRYNVY